MFRRFGLFLAVNIGVIVTISLVLNLFGFSGYLTQAGISYGQLAIFCLVWGMVGSLVSLYLSKFFAKTLLGVVVIDGNSDPQQLSLLNKVANFSKMAELPKIPEVGIYENEEINAFATGPSKNNSLVAFSKGALNTLSEEELEGVIAHEISHISNGDMVTMTILQGVINAFVMFLARVAAFLLQNFLKGDEDEESPAAYGGFAYMISVFIFEIFFSIFAKFILSFFSRIREYKADFGGANLAGKEKMIAALEALLKNRELLAVATDNMKAMKISSSPSFMELLSTHPPLEERIKRLKDL